MSPDGPPKDDDPPPAVAEPPTEKPVASDKPVEDKPVAKAEPAAKPEAKKAEKAAEKPVEAKPVAKAAPKPEPAKPTKLAEPAKPEIPVAPPWWKTLRADPPAYVRLALGLGLIALVFGVWWFVTHGEVVERIVSPVRLPSPGDVFGSWSKLMDRELGHSTRDTLERVLKGVALAAVVGVGMGILAASHRGVNAAIAPLVIFLRSVPMGALIPLTLMLFGDAEGQKTKFIFLAIVGFVFSDTVKAISIVPERYVETAQTLGASRWQIIRKVLVPLALPDIITSLRFQFGLALGYIMLAEEINTEYGLGQLINVSQRSGKNDQALLIVFVLALIAFSIDLVLRTLQRGLFTWRRDL